VAEKINWRARLRPWLDQKSPDVGRKFLVRIVQTIREIDATERPDLMRGYARDLVVLYKREAPARLTMWFADHKGVETGAGADRRGEVKRRLESLSDPALEPEENVMVILAEIAGRFTDKAFLQWLPKKIAGEQKAQRAAQAAEDL